MKTKIIAPLLIIGSILSLNVNGQSVNDSIRAPKVQTILSKTTSDDTSLHALITERHTYNNIPGKNKGLGRDLLTQVLINGNVQPNSIIIASHRAQLLGSKAPENSKTAIDEVLRNENCDVIELDLKISKDGQVYVMHDNYLQRTTNFLDVFPGTVGTGSDNYGKFDNYTWDQIKDLKLKRSDFTVTNDNIPLFRDVVKYIRDFSEVLINLDINDPTVFAGAWKVVEEENAFNVCIFKSGTMSVSDYKTNYYDTLSEANKAKVIFFPMITMNPPGGLTPMQAYESWENTSPVLAKGYELGYRGNPSEDALLDVVDAVRSKNRVRVHVFSTLPDNYKGRYMGNVNINQCCNTTYDARGDWQYLLDPRSVGNMDKGVNGYIIADDADTLHYFLQAHGKRPSTNN